MSAADTIAQIALNIRIHLDNEGRPLPPHQQDILLALHRAHEAGELKGYRDGFNKGFAATSKHAADTIELVAKALIR